MTPHKKTSADEMVDQARTKIMRVPPQGLDQFMAEGGLVVDIRPQAQRNAEGELPGALIVERNVLEWRFDLSGDYSLAEIDDYTRPILLVCSEGYASSLAAASLIELGYSCAGDLEGGYMAWLSYQSKIVVRPEASTSKD
jgi:rhodanese-related sulfurtransferase